MVLNYIINQFNGSEIDTKNLLTDSTNFNKLLINSIKELKEKNIEVVWLSIPLEKSQFVPVATANGFIYHHADQYGAVLTLKLKQDAFIPGYATHYIGAGGVVLDQNNRLLVIQEKYHNKKHYKLPGGALDPSEHIADAVIREVFEETGIQTEFVSLNCFRHWHEYRYGKSDIYFACRLKPLNKVINIDEREISKAIWMPVQEYLNDPETRIFNKKIVESTLNSIGLKALPIRDYGTAETHELFFG